MAATIAKKNRASKESKRNAKIRLHKNQKALFSGDTRFYIITGGRGSGKSYGTTTFANMLTYEAGHRILFTRYTMTSAHLSIIPEFTEKIEKMGVSPHFHVNKTEI